MMDTYDSKSYRVHFMNQPNRAIVSRFMARWHRKIQV